MKYEIPSHLLVAIEAKIKEHSDLISHKPDETCFYNLIDRTPGSNYYFKIFRDGKRHIGDYQEGNFAFEWRPGDHTVTNQARSQGQLNVVLNQFDNWIKLVKIHSSTPSVHDDIILEKYQRDFKSRYSFSPDENDNEPFNLEQQILLDEYLMKVIEKLEHHKENRDIAEIQQLQEIQTEAQALKKSITQVSKRTVRERLTKIWAKAQIVGLDVLKGIIVEFTAEITKRLLLGPGQ